MFVVYNYLLSAQDFTYMSCDSSVRILEMFLPENVCLLEKLPLDKYSRSTEN